MKVPKTFQLIFVTLMIGTLILASISDARYLPTRADETDVEVLKTIIKGVSTTVRSVLRGLVYRTNQINSPPYS